MNEFKIKTGLILGSSPTQPVNSITDSSAFERDASSTLATVKAIHGFVETTVFPINASISRIDASLNDQIDGAAIFVPTASIGYGLAWHAGMLDVSVSSGGSATLAGLLDVSISDVSNFNMLRYDSDSSKWINIAPIEASSLFWELTIPLLREASIGTGLNWVDGFITAAAGTPNVANGLQILADGSIGLGGLINQNTNIELFNNELIISGSDGLLGMYMASVPNLLISLYSGNGGLQMYGGPGGSVSLYSNNDSLHLIDDGIVNGTTFYSNLGKGIEYGADYSATFVDRSLIDKAWVQTQLVYVDTSLIAIDSSIFDIWLQLLQLDASIQGLNASLNDFADGDSIYLMDSCIGTGLNWVDGFLTANGVPNVANGLVILGDGSIGLGGTLTESTTITLTGNTLELIESGGGVGNGTGLVIMPSLGYTNLTGLVANNDGGSLTLYPGSFNHLWFGDGDTGAHSTGIQQFAQYIALNNNGGEIVRFDASGFRYSSDLSYLWGPNSLVDKNYVDLSIGAVWTKLDTIDARGGDNGLGILGDGSIGLGGILNKITTVDLNAFYFAIKDNTVGNGIQFNLNEAGSAYITGTGGELWIAPSSAYISHYNVTGGSQFLLNGPTGVFNVGANPIIFFDASGLRYSSDYSYLWNERSIPDVGYVNSSLGVVWTKFAQVDASLDDVVDGYSLFLPNASLGTGLVWDSGYLTASGGGGSIGAANGLHILPDGSIGFGGELIGETSIGLLSYNYAVYGFVDYGGGAILQSQCTLSANAGSNWVFQRLDTYAYSNFGISSDLITLQTYNQNTGAQATLNFGTAFGAPEAGNLQLTFSGIAGIIDLNPTPAGLQYQYDYSATMVGNSLIHKGYVDACVGVIWTKFAQVDASLDDVVDGYSLFVPNASLGLGLSWNTVTNLLDVSIVSSDPSSAEIWNQISQLDASIIRIDASLNDVVDAYGVFLPNSSIGSGLSWNHTNYLDVSIAQDPSINQLYTMVLDSSITKIGNQNTDGSWRFVIDSSGNLSVQKRITGSWVEKGNFN